MPKSYEFRPVAEPHNHQVYNTWMKALGLKESERLDLRRRGLTEEQIKTAGYATKQINTAQDTYNALGKLKTFGLDLDNVPGFFVNDKTGHADQSRVSGLAIASRDMNGHISSILIRNDRAKIGNDGKVKNKYLSFSSVGKTKGNKPRQTTHCPIVRGTAKKNLGTSARITEGPLKADVATALGDKYCFGMHGLNIPHDLAAVLTELEIQELIIALDAGEDENFDILRCKAKLMKICNEIGIDYKVEIWDAQYGKGIDDVLKNGHEDKIKYAAEEEAEKTLEDADEADPYNGEWLYIVRDKEFLNIVTGQRLDKSQFADEFRLGKPEVANEFIASGFKKVYATAFLPSGELFVTEEGIKCFNTWKPSKIIPSEGNVKPFTDHLEYILPDETQRKILLDWLAFNVQKPGVKILWALVMIGDEGIGKSIIGWIMRKILGEDNVGTPTNEEIHEPYTAWQKDKQFIIIEELMAGGKRELMNRLKPIITEPTTQIREMRRTSYRAPNRFNILAFTNHDDALILGDGDRRYGVLKADVKRKGEEYYKGLWAWIKEEKNLQAIHHLFMARDLSIFNEHAKPPETQAKRDMIGKSKLPLEEWVSGLIADRAWPFNKSIVVIRHLRDREICPHGFEKISDYKWAEALKKSGAIKYPQQVPLTDGSRATLWLIGENKHILENHGPKALAEIYQKARDPKATPQEIKELENNILSFNDDSNPISNGGRGINPVEDDMPI